MLNKKKVKELIHNCDRAFNNIYRKLDEVDSAIADLSATLCDIEGLVEEDAT